MSVTVTEFQKWTLCLSSNENAGRIHVLRSSGQGPGHTNKTACLCVLFGCKSWMSWPTKGYNLNVWRTCTPSWYFGQGRISRSWGQGHGHDNKKSKNAGDPPLLKDNLVEYNYTVYLCTLPIVISEVRRNKRCICNCNCSSAVVIVISSWLSSLVGHAWLTPLRSSANTVLPHSGSNSGSETKIFLSPSLARRP